MTARISENASTCARAISGLVLKLISSGTPNLRRFGDSSYDARHPIKLECAA
jgi:hypothetical protein